MFHLLNIVAGSRVLIRESVMFDGFVCVCVCVCVSIVCFCT